MSLAVRHIVLLCFALLLCGGLAAQSVSFKGRVIDKNTGAPIEYATIVIKATEQWTVADAKGEFIIQNIRTKKSVVEVSCLGYVTYTKELSFSKDIPTFKALLLPDNLALEDAVVTAQEKGNSTATSRVIDRTALDHVQVMNVTDISALLPGGVTANNNLTSSQQFNLRAGTGSEMGNASFGTAVEVDGVRLSNNASFAEASTSNTVKGSSTNNVASANVESIEVITGVPSVEYGDMSSGVVKINTRKGKTPWMITLSTSPRTKQLSASKGFSLGKTSKGASLGVMNAALEYTRSVSDPLSPYTSYDRKQLSLSWFNLFNSGAFSAFPLRVNFSVSGNLGGLNTQADPDALQGTWTINRDNVVRAQLSLDWQLARSWITNVELTGAVSYSDKLARERVSRSSSATVAALHGREEGYYMAMPWNPECPEQAVVNIPPGYWFNEKGDDDRPFSSKVNLKANWVRNFGEVNNKLKLGVDWTCDVNFGTGVYSTDMATAPTFRRYVYSDNPAMHNFAAYLEDKVAIPIGAGRLDLVAGLRCDNTYIKGSAYGLTTSLSPRFNVKYIILSAKGRGKKAVRELSVRGGWGEAVKLPSFSVLFPMPTYRDVLAFTSTSNSANEYSTAYFIQPCKVEYNPDLRWQRNRMAELAVETNLWGNKISLVGFWNRTLDTYRIASDYDRTTYTYTPTASLDAVPIPADDRVFAVDRQTGVVTVSDNQGVHSSQTLASETYKRLSLRYFPSNEPSPVDRYGLEWVLDFAPIKAIGTNFRIDGTWYQYRGITSGLYSYAYAQNSAQDNRPYRYIGYYYGNNSYTNGSESQTLRLNLTITTRIPKVRMIVSLKLESCLLRYSRSLSEREDGSELAQVISNKSDILSLTGESIYAGDNYVVRFPEYYTTFDDPTPRNYLADLRAARAAGNDKLFNDLWQLAYRNEYVYTFGKDWISPYFSANFSVTKEIGDIASISFYANNFFNNTSQVYSTKTRSWMSSSSYIPSFYYGLTVRLKF